MTPPRAAVLYSAVRNALEYIDDRIASDDAPRTRDTHVDSFWMLHSELHSALEGERYSCPLLSAPVGPRTY